MPAALAVFVALAASAGADPSACGDPAAAATTDQPDVTLVTQSSFDRLWRVEHLCRRWKGPIALGVGVFARGSLEVTVAAGRRVARRPRSRRFRPSLDARRGGLRRRATSPRRASRRGRFPRCQARRRALRARRGARGANARGGLLPRERAPQRGLGRGDDVARPAA
mmetsp:Transcript_21156/g.63143  ORF Transcript_21156/g.63143 Transcript_21156/m.63143 type:complete len:167 (+) Transcript_21156:205-705(+)